MSNPIIFHQGTLIQVGTELKIKDGDKTYLISSQSQELLETLGEGDKVHYCVPSNSGQYACILCPRCKHW